LPLLRRQQISGNLFREVRREREHSFEAQLRQNHFRPPQRRSSLILVCSLFHAGNSHMKVVLFCGGLGLRLRDYAHHIPKPMISIGSRPILWHVMKYFAHFGHKDFILCLVPG
jgi:hypothetical protein